MGTRLWGKWEICVETVKFKVSRDEGYQDFFWNWISLDNCIANLHIDEMASMYFLEKLFLESTRIDINFLMHDEFLFSVKPIY